MPDRIYETVTDLFQTGFEACCLHFNFTDKQKSETDPSVSGLFYKRSGQPALADCFWPSAMLFKEAERTL